ncbi:MAG: serine/threonine-protein kinase, partial [Polyangiaceae bacterium]
METDEPIVSVRPGDVLVGKYRVERILGVGGMGVVVAAHHLQLDEKVAIKLLLPEALKNSQAVARFAREARTAVKIKSEHVAKVTDVGELPDGAPYIVMEYLEGADLGAILQKSGALPIARAVDFLLQACVAVAEAHALRIVHRDLKPANLFCIQRSDGQQVIKVLDFGISKLNDAASAASASMTKTSAVMGTPLYMSPEQMRSAKVVDSRTDIWALGVILYELVAGVAPFEAPSVMELAINIAQEPPPPLRDKRPDAPPELEAVILACVEKDPEQRYANVGELATALLPFAPPHARALVDRITGIIRSAGLPSGPRSSMVDIGVAAGAVTASPGTMGAMERSTGGNARGGKPIMALVGAAVGTVAVLGLGGWLLLRKPEAPPASAGSTPASASVVAPPPAPPPPAPV